MDVGGGEHGTATGSAVTRPFAELSDGAKRSGHAHRAGPAAARWLAAQRNDVYYGRRSAIEAQYSTGNQQPHHRRACLQHRDGLINCRADTCRSSARGRLRRSGRRRSIRRSALPSATTSITGPPISNRAPCFDARTPEHLDRGLECLVDGYCALRQPVLQGLAFKILHDEERRAFCWPRPRARRCADGRVPRSRAPRFVDLTHPVRADAGSGFIRAEASPQRPGARRLWGLYSSAFRRLRNRCAQIRATITSGFVIRSARRSQGVAMSAKGVAKSVHGRMP